jgi:hypothetical protein
MIKAETSEQIATIGLVSCAALGAITVAFFVVKLLSLQWTAVLVFGVGAVVVVATRRRALPPDERTDGPRATEELSVVCSGGSPAVMVPFGTRLPTEQSDTFSTAADRQPNAEVRLVASGAISASQPRVVAVVTHPIQNPGPRRGPQIRVKLIVDARGQIEIEITEGSTTRVGHYRGSRMAVTTSTCSAVN